MQNETGAAVQSESGERATRVRVLQFAATHGGGLATHVAALARGLSRAKYDVRVLCPPVGDLRRRLEGDGIPADYLPFAAELDLIGDVRQLGPLLEYLRHHRFDIVHTHSTKAGLWGRAAARLCGIPLALYTPNAYRFLRYRRGSMHWRLYVGLEWIMGRVGSGTVAAGPSEASITRELRLAPEDRQFVVNNGVPVAALQQARRDASLRQRLGLPARGPLVVTVGRLTAQKAPLMFVEIARKVADAHPDVGFVMVGDGELDGPVRERAERLGIAHRLRIISSTDEIPALLLEADVFVMTSVYEGLSYAAAEAAALGCALVVSDVPGLRDLVDNDSSGLLIDVGNVAQFASAISRLLADPDRRISLGRCATRLIQERFSMEGMIRDTEALYDRLLVGRLD